MSATGRSHTTALASVECTNKQARHSGDSGRVTVGFVSDKRESEPAASRADECLIGSLREPVGCVLDVALLAVECVADGAH